MSARRQPSRWAARLALAGMVLSLAGCAGSPRNESTTRTPPTLSLELHSPAFANGDTVPVRFTCDGENLSPPLQWSGVPIHTKSLALLCEDPDAPGGLWVHWVVHGIDTTRTELAEGTLPGDASVTQGENDFKSPGYGGPCPPPGKAHHYVFHLYAVDREVGLSPGATRRDLLAAIQGHVIAQAELIGIYRRK